MTHRYARGVQTAEVLVQNRAAVDAVVTGPKAEGSWPP